VIVGLEEDQEVMNVFMIERDIRKYFWIGLVAAKSHLAYLPELAGRLVFLAIILFIFLRLWQVTYEQTGAKLLAGLSLTEMLWYLTLTEAIALSEARVAQLVDEDVRTGALSLQLVRPFSYPLYRLASNLGERLTRFLANLVVGAFLAVCFVGLPALPWKLLPISLTAVLLAFVIDFLSQFCIGLGAFWMEDTSGLLLIYRRLAMILGGMLMPIEILPDGWQAIVKYLPISNIYPAARLFVDSSLALGVELILRQCLIIGVLWLVTASLYRLALRRVAANGG
jgi:ABC-2 type transport system permease protein